MKNLVWLEEGVQTEGSPVVGCGCSPNFLLHLGDAQYLQAYNNAIKPENMSLHQPSKAQLQRFTTIHIPALRSIMSQVLHWVLPSPRLSKNRYSQKKDIVHVFRAGFFDVHNIETPFQSARNLINLVAQIVFAPSHDPNLRGYPTVITRDPTTDKINTITPEDYILRFKSHWA